MDGKQLKNSILQWAIQGKLVPQNPKDEPAQKLLERIAASRNESSLSLPKGTAKGTKSKDLKKKKSTPSSRIYRENGVWYEQVGTAAPKDISDEIPFEIPENWAWCRLKDVFETSSGSTPLSSRLDYYKNGSVNWVRTTDLNNGVLNKCEKQITELARKDYNLNIIPRNSICIAMYGGKGTIGKYALIDFDTTINQSVCAIFPNEYCYAKFFFYYMQYYRPLWMQFAAGSRKDPNINQIIIKNCFIPIAPLAEQKRIVAKLEQVLPLAEEYGAAQKQLDKLNKELPEALKKSILQQAIQGKLVPQNPKDEPAQKLLERIAASRNGDVSPWSEAIGSSKNSKKSLSTSLRGAKATKQSKNPPSRIYRENGVWYEQVGSASPKDISDEIPFEIPGTWTWCRMGDIIEFVNGRAYKKEELLSKGKYKVLRVGNFFTNQSWYFSDLELPEDKYCYNGDLLYAWSASFGPQIWNGDKTIFHYHIWNLKYDTQNLYREYLYYFFLYDKNQIGASTTGSTMIHVSMEHMIPRLIPIPPLAEQKRIVKKIEELYKVIDSWK